MTSPNTRDDIAGGPSDLHVADPDKLSPSDLPDIQGFIVHGYNMPKSRHFVITIGQLSAALGFLAALTNGVGPLSVTSGARWPGGKKPEYALNLGLTAPGLQALELPGDVNIDPFTFGSFLGGAIGAALEVGDTGANDPSNWVPKLNTENANLAHVLLSLYTNTSEDRETYSQILREMFAPVIPTAGTPGSDVFEQDVDPLVEIDPVTGEKFRKIHFGYTDGISNPIIDSTDLPAPRPNQLPYIPAYQFVLRDGNPNYDIPTPFELGQNGTFSAFRILEQNVSAFDAFLKADGRDESAQEVLMSKLCGRWRNGNPLVLRPDEQGAKLPDDQLVDFDYGTDSIGQPCPYSSHTRRTNSRGSQLVNPVGDQIDHRILRRADAYGPPYTGVADGEQRGLAGHFICTILFDQFEFVMSQWVNNPDFPGKFAQAGIDPLLGNVPEGSTFTYWEGGQPVTVASPLTQFVTTRGGLYCFVPSITAIKWMAANGGAANPWTIPSASS